MEALEARTAKLPPVEIVRVDPKVILGRSTVESIQSGLYFGTIGQLNHLTQMLTEECFKGGEGEDKPLVLATGGFSGLFERAGIFDAVIPDLVLKGLNLALRMNT
jgi:type III pantothenate kinase